VSALVVIPSAAASDRLAVIASNVTLAVSADGKRRLWPSAVQSIVSAPAATVWLGGTHDCGPHERVMERAAGAIRWTTARLAVRRDRERDVGRIDASRSDAAALGMTTSADTSATKSR